MTPKPWRSLALADLLLDDTPGFWGGPPGGNGDVAVLRSTNLREDGKLDLSDVALRSFPEKKRAQKQLQRGDIVLERSGGGPKQPVGRVARFDADGTYSLSNFMQCLRPNPLTCDSRFLTYELVNFHRTGGTETLQQATTGIRNLQYRDYLARVLLVPPLSEQIKITAILSAVDDAIEAMQAVIEQLQVVKTAMMCELLNSASWEQSTVGDLIVAHGGEVRTGPFGTVLRADEQDSAGTPLVSVREIRDGFIEVVAQTPRVPSRVLDRLPHYLLSEGDIVFARKRAVDRCAVVGPAESGWMMGSDCIRIRLPHIIDPWFASYWFRTPAIRSYILGRSVGSTTMVTLNQRTLESVLVPLAPLEVQQKISVALQSVEAAAQENVARMHCLHEVKKAVAHVLLSGELRVTPDEDVA